MRWAVDTSQWKCESCPFEKEGRSGTVDVGVIGVSDDSQKFGDFTGLDKQGAYLGLGGNVRYRGDNGVYGSVVATDLGLDTRAIDFEGGREGLYTLKLGYSEIPRHQADGAMTPFLGVGGSRADAARRAFRQPTPRRCRWRTTLQPVDVSSKRKRFDAGFTWIAGDQWSTQLTFRRDVRDGLQRDRRVRSSPAPRSWWRRSTRRPISSRRRPPMPPGACRRAWPTSSRCSATARRR